VLATFAVHDLSLPGHRGAGLGVELDDPGAFPRGRDCGGANLVLSDGIGGQPSSVVVEGGGTTRADGSGSGSGGGGLGLAVVKTLVEAQHGTIAITSGHRGTTATIRLRFVD
jgi:hypothetical protein